MQQSLTYPGVPRSRGLTLGLSLSLLLHLALLALWRTPSVPRLPADERRWTEPLSVRLLPPPPPPAAARVEPPKPPEKTERRPKPRAAPAQPTAAPNEERPPVTVVAPVKPAEPAEPAPDPLSPDAPGKPAFDPDAVRASAGKAAKDVTPPPTNWVAAKLNKDKEWQETKEQKLGRAIAGSARADCKTAYAGLGIFAPLKMMLDKKDSGCKF